MHLFALLRIAGLASLFVAIAALPAAAQSAKATLKNTQGKEVGTAQLTQAATGGVLIGLPAGDHAFRVHASANASRHSPRRRSFQSREQETRHDGTGRPARRRHAELARACKVERLRWMS